MRINIHRIAELGQKPGGNLINMPNLDRSREAISLACRTCFRMYGCGLGAGEDMPKISEFLASVGFQADEKKLFTARKVAITCHKCALWEPFVGRYEGAGVCPRLVWPDNVTHAGHVCGKGLPLRGRRVEIKGRSAVCGPRPLVYVQDIEGLIFLAAQSAR